MALSSKPEWDEAVGDLISRPGTPLQAFFEGAGAAALAVGLPLTGAALVMAFKADRLWAGVAFSLVFTAAAALLAGLAWAGWRLVQLWAYDRFTSGPFE